MAVTVPWACREMPHRLARRPARKHGSRGKIRIPSLRGSVVALCECQSTCKARYPMTSRALMAATHGGQPVCQTCFAPKLLSLFLSTNSYCIRFYSPLRMEACRFALAALYAVMMIFVFFGTASAADELSPSPSPEPGAGSLAFVPSVAAGLMGSVIAFFACFFY
eukprot:Gb_17090 [translate_table: standard]